MIDSSSIIWIKQNNTRSECARIFRELDGLVAAGQLLFPKTVLGEMERWVGTKDEAEDPPLAWVKRNSKHLKHLSDRPDTLTAVLAEVPQVLDPDKVGGAEEADPYVLALALMLQHAGRTVTVLNEERKDRTDKMSLTTPCGVLRLVALPVATFLARRGLRNAPF
ncbi:MAG: DUF4411 family protein [Vicinamibacteria bacterium]